MKVKNWLQGHKMGEMNDITILITEYIFAQKFL